MMSGYEWNDKSSFVGELARKTEHSTATGDVRTWQLTRAAILLPRREKMEKISLQCANKQHRVPRRVQHFRGILNRKKADIGAVAKTPKVLLDVDTLPTARRRRPQVLPSKP